MPARTKRTKPKKARRAAPARRSTHAPKRGKKKAKSSAKKPKKAATKPKKAAAKPKKPAKKKARAAARKPSGAKRSAGKARAAAKKKPAKKTGARERERERAAKQKERERVARERERERERREREREKAAKQKEREREKKQKEQERERARKQKEQERLAKEKARERERQQKLAAQLKAQKAAERAKERAEREEARRREREEAKRQREAERLAREAERERVREEARRIKEEERAKREAEREAYRKAKEAERERLRAEREAARRALEGRVARATKRAQRVAGVGRGVTTRVYRPDLIPNQSGTTRRVPEGLNHRFLGVKPPEQIPIPEEPAPSEVSATGELAPGGEAPPVSTPKEPPPDKLDERYAVIVERLKQTDDDFRREYSESFDMSWIYHDSALEGVVYTFQELKTAIDPNITVVPDSSLQPVCEEIRRHKAAIDMVRELSEKKRVPINVDMIKKIYLTLHPEEGDLKSVKYRKDIPQHRLYFHEYAPPDKIAYRVRQVLDWLNGPEPKKIKNPIRIASRVHYDLLRIFPFPQDSGKVARLLMNLILLRNGYPPAIVHSTERQRYYEALKGSLPTIVGMVQEAILNALASIEKKLDERDTRLRAFSV